ncbi:enoyl-CoA hydratase/isomerase family protein [Lawsonibacter celer]|uniref:enoyl-CoA hydratase/isomerase family protein n=1 Tax=Lawsonibacter celer TaxID=2986526 RepID=UPI001645903D
MIQLSDLRTVYSNEEAALLDMGDGIGCLQFRSKGNSISAPVREFIVELLAHNLYEFDGMVIASQSKHFSVGANLVNMKNNIDAKNFTAMENNVRSFQSMTAGIKYSKKPIVAVPYRMTLGGGLEVVLHSSARVALGKCYMGLVETGVGLLPGGGGTKCTAMLLDGLTGQALEETLIRLFDKLIFGKVSKNAQEAREMMYLYEDDIIVEEEEDLIAVAKARCLDLIAEGYQPPAAGAAVLPGKAGYDLLLRHSEALQAEGKITAYDFEIGKRIALILAGSSTENAREYTEQEILDQERRCFVELTQSEGTYRRIDHFLRTNEKLRN